VILFGIHVGIALHAIDNTVPDLVEQLKVREWSLVAVLNFSVDDGCKLTSFSWSMLFNYYTIPSLRLLKSRSFASI